VILEDYLMAISAAQERIQRCERAMIDRLPSWRLKAAVDTLMAFKGFQLLAAMITVSELGALQRFAHPRQVMAYLGLVPSESTSSDKRRQGGITKTGNSHARWILIECAQHYAAPPKVSKELSHRQSGQPLEVIALSWKAQNRLHSRFMHLAARRLARNKIIVAIVSRPQESCCKPRDIADARRKDCPVADDIVRIHYNFSIMRTASENSCAPFARRLRRHCDVWRGGMSHKNASKCLPANRPSSSLRGIVPSVFCGSFPVGSSRMPCGKELTIRAGCQMYPRCDGCHPARGCQKLVRN
jgi:Transposase IS116/IS110/IS902 family